MCKLLWGLLLLLILSNPLVSGAQELGKKAKEQSKATNESPILEPRISSKLSSLLSKARAVPAELRSESLIRLATSNLAEAKDLKVELLEEAFDYAGSSAFAVKKTQFAGTYADTPSGYLAHAYRLDLDAISLRCLVVSAMSRLDRKRARELFAGIAIKSSIQSALSCNDLLVPDVRAYYETFTELAKNTFSAKEIEGGYKAQFIENRIYDLISPVQIAPLAKALTALNLDIDELERFIPPFSVKLRQISSDYRTFYGTEAMFSVTESIKELISLMEKRGIPSRVLADAYRDYVVKTASQRLCADNYEGEGRLPSLVRRANFFVFGWKPITTEEVKTSGVDPSYEEAPFWTSRISRKVIRALQRLRFNEKAELYTDAERETPRWKEQFEDVPSLMANWKADDERSEEAYLNEKAIAYSTLVELAPTDTMRVEALQDFLNFLAGVNPDRINRIVLYWHMKRVIVQAKTTDGKVRSDVVTKLAGSTHPILQLYASLISDGV
jgi:hypothetical protein